MAPNDEPDEFTRFRFHAQRGDGPDRRGDVTVEIQRDRHPRTSRDNIEVELPNGDVVKTQKSDATFAEFVFETDRAMQLLVHELGLDDDDE